MNYIPGFSNYLQTAIPRYAVGGRVMGGERMMYDGDPTQGDEYNMSGGEVVVPAVQPMVQPMTQEAVAPYDLSGLDLSGLDSLYGMNFGSNFGGGPMGGVYEADPNLQYIAAPLSNKGNATSQTGGNTFAVRVDQPVRLVDHRTNQVVFEGTGFDAARKATELGQGLTDQFGRKANYSIQTADPSGNYSTVAYEKKNKSTLGQIANVVGTVAPLALGFVPGFGQLGLLAKVGAAAGAGGLGAALKGDNILKGALLGGATAGIVSGTGLDKALGGALGGLGKGATQGAVQGATQAGGQAAGQAAGDIVVTGLSKGLQAAGGALGQAALSQAGKAGLSEITGYKTPTERFAQQQTPVDDTIVVSGDRFASGSGSPFAAAVPIPVNAMLSGALSAAEPTPAEKTAEDIEAEKNPIVVDAPTNLLPADFATSAAAAAAANAANGMGNAPDRAEMTDEELDTYMNSVGKGGGLGAALADMTLAQKINLLGLGVTAAGAIGKAVGGGGGTGQTGTYTRGGGSLNPIFSAKLPSAGGLGAVGAARTARPMGDQDWLTYGTRPELNFFDYSSPTGPAPITTPIPNEPRGPSMYVPDTTRFAKGGRAEFAVNGPGTGRSDDIPAVLSDGEYVIDAETVALLGDGSSKAGAKKLDELRVKVRKHKGQKLAKGRFSANAKKPEAYLSGGLTR
ncbi:hypothetical protein UFOVP714_43 [uncultured Caudovirales phage]|uniref:Uncharacterized protein n=1 Tax=uncultured Caudovirales phage TaxID=2100421 RepID=A0A6J5NUN3_9CAUD|nr:hypothetical protein UFOVP714_43 [uncultured Caudovirales phage]CAB4167398.1 hypothetical protein UFOVP864_17 [uncultured Caudovirales phage]